MNLWALGAFCAAAVILEILYHRKRADNMSTVTAVAKNTKTWCGAAPTHCDMCREPIRQEFVNGAIKAGPWACMCISCLDMYGAGIGPGRGQRYSNLSGPDGVRRWYKTAG